MDEFPEHAIAWSWMPCTFWTGAQPSAAQLWIGQKTAGDSVEEAEAWAVYF